MAASIVLSASGVTIPQFNDILDYLNNGVRTIFGADVYLEPDSQDEQLLAIFAEAINENNQSGVAVYNAYSPATAQGVGLSSVVKINGLARLSASRSQADLLLTGVVGTEINNGIAGDKFGNQWALPPLVVIDVTGQVVATAICTTIGAINVSPGAIDKIITPTRGWQTVTNTLAAVPGNPVEDDATLRQRQSVSTGLPALSVLDSIVGSIANLPGVVRYKGYENDTNISDTNGIPPHSISMVVLGGDAQTIANSISLKKTPGTGTFGNISEVVVDPKGIPNTINFFALAVIPIKVRVTILASLGYTSALEAQIKQSVADYISGLPIGSDVRINKIYAPANLDDILNADVYDVELIETAIIPNAFATTNIIIAFNQAASCSPDDVTVVVNA